MNESQKANMLRSLEQVIETIGNLPICANAATPAYIKKKDHVIIEALQLRNENQYVALDKVQTALRKVYSDQSITSLCSMSDLIDEMAERLTNQTDIIKAFQHNPRKREKM